MSTIRILSCSASYLARTSFSQAQKTIISSFLPTGVISTDKTFSSARSQHTLTCPISCELRFPVVKPSFSVHELARYSFSTKPSPSPTPSSRATPRSSSTKTPNTTTSTSPTTSPSPSLDENECKPGEKQFKSDVDDMIFGDCSKLTQFGKFKLMYKKYWYVLIPVHVATSISWIVGFYYLSKSGVDIPAMLQYIHISETIIEKVKNSNMGHYAIAYLCYKVITPVRYAVSLGMTTVSIKRLVFAGYIKPIPTKKEFMEMYEQKKADRAKRKESEAKTP